MKTGIFTYYFCLILISLRVIIVDEITSSQKNQIYFLLIFNKNEIELVEYFKYYWLSDIKLNSGCRLNSCNFSSDILADRKTTDPQIKAAVANAKFLWFLLIDIAERMRI